MPFGAPGRGSNNTFLNTAGVIIAQNTASGTFLVPAGVQVLTFVMCGPGAGGGGGNNTPGGGGGGGGAGFACGPFQYFVNPGDTVTIVISAVGVGGAPKVNGTGTGDSSISGSTVDPLQYAIRRSGGGIAGAAVNGGNGGDIYFAGGATGGAGAGASSTVTRFAGLYGGVGQPGAAGGALNFNGGISAFTGNTVFVNAALIAAATGGAAGGGGGQGGYSLFGAGGAGGSNGAAGAAPTFGYGGGGGGGSGNASGGDGAGGLIRYTYVIPAARIQP